MRVLKSGCKYFSMPPASETREISKMYGKMIRSMETVTANFSGSAEKPGALI